MSETAWQAAVAGIIAVISSISTAIGTYYTLVTKNKKEAEDAAIVRYKELIELQGKKLAEYGEQVNVLERKINALAEEHFNCNISLDRLFMWAQTSHRLNVRFAKALGINLEDEIGPIPQKPVIQVIPRTTHPTT